MTTTLDTALPWLGAAASGCSFGCFAARRPLPWLAIPTLAYAALCTAIGPAPTAALHAASALLTGLLLRPPGPRGRFRMCSEWSDGVRVRASKRSGHCAREHAASLARQHRSTENTRQMAVPGPFWNGL